MVMILLPLKYYTFFNRFNTSFYFKHRFYNNLCTTSTEPLLGSVGTVNGNLKERWLFD